MMGRSKNIVVQDISEFKGRSKEDTYNKVGSFIFYKGNDDKDVILIGDVGSVSLPIPLSSRVVLKASDVSSAKLKQYVNMGYSKMSEKQILNNMTDFIEYSSTHTATLDLDGKKSKTFDVYKLWFLTKGLDAQTIDVSNMMKQVFGSDKYDDVKHLKLWGRTTMSNLKKYPEHAEKVKNADLSYPIIMMIHNKEARLVDGIHRLVRAFLTKKKFVKIVIASSDILRKARI